MKLCTLLLFCSLLLHAFTAPVDTQADKRPAGGGSEGDTLIASKRFKGGSGCRLLINELSTLYLSMQNRTTIGEEDKHFIELKWTNCADHDSLSLAGFLVVLLDSRKLSSAFPVPIAMFELKGSKMFLKDGVVNNPKKAATSGQSDEFFVIGFPSARAGDKVNLDASKNTASVNHLPVEDHPIFNDNQVTLAFGTSISPAAKPKLVAAELAQLPYYVLLLHMSESDTLAFKKIGFSQLIYESVSRNTIKNPKRGEIHLNDFERAWNLISDSIVDGLVVYRTPKSKLFPSPLLQKLAIDKGDKFEVLQSKVKVHGSMDIDAGKSLSRCTNSDGYVDWRITSQTKYAVNDCGADSQRVTRIQSNDAWQSPVTIIPETLRMVDLTGEEPDGAPNEPDTVVQGVCAAGDFLEDDRDLPPLEPHTPLGSPGALTTQSPRPSYNEMMFGLEPSTDDSFNEMRFGSGSGAPDVGVVEPTCDAPAIYNVGSGACISTDAPRTVGAMEIDRFREMVKSTVANCLREAGVDKLEGKDKENVVLQTSNEVQALLKGALYLDPKNRDRSTVETMNSFDVPTSWLNRMNGNQAWAFLKAYSKPGDNNIMVVECELDKMTWEFEAEVITLPPEDKTSFRYRWNTAIRAHAAGRGKNGPCTAHSLGLAKKMAEFGHTASKAVVSRLTPAPVSIYAATANMLATAYYETLADIPPFQHPLTTDFVSSLGADIGRIHRSRDSATKMRVFLSGEVHSELCQYMQKHNVRFSLMLDSSTDTTGRQNLMVYVRFMHQSEHVPVVYYYGLVNMQEGETGESVFDAVVKLFDKDEGMLDHMVRFMIGMATDGTGVVAGMDRGFAGRMTRYIDENRSFPAQGIPQKPLHFKCQAHKLELALKDAYSKTKYEKLNAVHWSWRAYLTRFMNSIRSFYGVTAVKRVRDLRSAALLHNLPFLRLKEVIEVRWASSELAAIAQFIKAYPAILVNLKEYVLSLVNPTAAELKLKLRAQVYIDIMLDPEFYGYLTYEGSLLKCFSALSKQLQSVSANLLMTEDVILKFESCIDEMSKNPYLDYTKRMKVVDLDNHFLSPEDKQLKRDITFAYNVRSREKSSTRNHAKLNQAARKAFIEGDLETIEFGILPPHATNYEISDLLFKKSSAAYGEDTEDEEEPTEDEEEEEPQDDNDIEDPAVEGEQAEVADDNDGDLIDDDELDQQRAAGGNARVARAIKYSVDPKTFVSEVKSEIKQARKSMDKSTFNHLMLLKRFKDTKIVPLKRGVRMSIAKSMKLAVRNRLGEVPYAKFASFSVKALIGDTEADRINRAWVSEQMNFNKDVVEREFQELVASITALPQADRNHVLKDRLNVAYIHRALAMSPSVAYGPTLRSLYTSIICCPIASSDVERGFSQLEYIFSSRRKSMSTTVLDATLRLRLNGVSFDKFQKEKYAKRWLSTKHRPSDYDSSNPDHAIYLHASTGEEPNSDEPTLSDLIDERPLASIYI